MSPVVSSNTLSFDCFGSRHNSLQDEIDELIAHFGTNRSALIPILQEIKKRHAVINSFAMQYIADCLGISPANVYGVVSFYSFLNEKYDGRFVIRLCRTISCDMAGKENVARQLENDLGIKFGESTPDRKFSLEWANCIGMCDQGPAILVNEQIFTQVTPEKVQEILAACGNICPNTSSKRIDGLAMTIRNQITFASIPAGEGMRAALAKDPQSVIQEVIASGLRGRGGAGFPVGMKWKYASEAEGASKAIICNADEGEPGTFKDRVILSEWPDLVFEGMIIAGYAIGASLGIIYLRGEYAYLRESLEERLAERRTAGLLGKSVRDREGFSFDIHIHMGCGAYVCGEESALIESLEGKRGESRNRPPFPVVSGLFGAPTVVNNVETLAWVATLFVNGTDWFNKVGTERSTGYKLLSISGDVERPGVYEFPMGTKISMILEAAGAKNIKAAVVGGASGVLVPAMDFERNISFEDVSTGGSIIVFNQSRDLLDAVENFQEFFADESCGQCTICRMGNVKLLEGIRMLKEGKCTAKQTQELCALGASMQAASKCGLGQAAPNMFLSVLQHFRGEVMGRIIHQNHSTKRITS